MHQSKHAGFGHKFNCILYAMNISDAIAAGEDAGFCFHENFRKFIVARENIIQPPIHVFLLPLTSCDC